MNYPEEKKEYKRSSHLVYSCQYHIVFCPKYRRKVLTEEIAKRAKELFTQIAEENGFDILDMEIMSDHVHILVDCNPRFGVEHVVKLVNYPHLKKQASEEDSLKTQALNPQVLFFPVYPGDILCHVCKRDPVARQATPVFHR